MFHVVVTIPATSADPIVEFHQSREAAASRIPLAEGAGFRAASLEVSVDADGVPSARLISRCGDLPSEDVRRVCYHAEEAVLRRGFDAVADRDHWKNPIQALLSGERVEALGGAELIAQAIVYFTATEPALEELGGGIRFTAPGYWAGPAA